MNNRSIPWLPLCVLLLLVVLTFWLSGLTQPTNSRAGGKNRHDPDLVVEQFTAQRMAPNGDVQYVLTADKMTHYADDDSSSLDKIVFVANRPGHPTMTARAPSGRSLQGGDELILEGGVTILSTPGENVGAMKLSTPRLTVLPEKNLARSVDGTLLENSEGHLTAGKFELDSANNRVTFERVKATYQSPK
ncbi:MAG: LPS export ABC transporter periplasmic protein LptC [Betaproteobacteria bacterium]|nr:LPS export ABC transporter periplasmic protein LptC [Betaproteobacteria bacterium]